LEEVVCDVVQDFVEPGDLEPNGFRSIDALMVQLRGGIYVQEDAIELGIIGTADCTDTS